MNSRLFFFILLIFVVSCGVKKAPSPPINSIAPSFFDDYKFEEDEDLKEKEIKEKSKNE